MSDSASYRYARILGFRPIDPVTDAKRLIRYGRDLYVESLGSPERFHQEYGQRGEGFPAWIAFCVSENPGFAVFLTEDQKPIGLVVMGVDRRRSVGHVHHLYVEPAHRGQGFGGLLDDYARETLKGAGFMRARLNVTAANLRAIRFYTAQGWADVGPKRPAGLRYMEAAL